MREEFLYLYFPLTLIIHILSYVTTILVNVVTHEVVYSFVYGCDLN